MIATMAMIMMMIVKQGQGIISAHASFITIFLCFPFFNIFGLNLSLLQCKNANAMVDRLNYFNGWQTGWQATLEKKATMQHTKSQV